MIALRTKNKGLVVSEWTWNSCKECSMVASMYFTSAVNIKWSSLDTIE